MHSPAKVNSLINIAIRYAALWFADMRLKVIDGDLRYCLKFQTTLYPKTLADFFYAY